MQITASKRSIVLQLFFLAANNQSIPNCSGRRNLADQRRLTIESALARSLARPDECVSCCNSSQPAGHIQRMNASFCRRKSIKRPARRPRLSFDSWIANDRGAVTWKIYRSRSFARGLSVSVCLRCGRTGSERSSSRHAGAIAAADGDVAAATVVRRDTIKVSARVNVDVTEVLAGGEEFIDTEVPRAAIYRLVFVATRRPRRRHAR